MFANQSVAQAHCLSHGGRLAVLPSAEEMAAVQAFFQAELSLEYTWVDGSDAEVEGVWRTSDGEVMTYLGWADSEPNGGTFSNCRAIYDLYAYALSYDYDFTTFLCVM